MVRYLLLNSDYQLFLVYKSILYISCGRKNLHIRSHLIFVQLGLAIAHNYTMSYKHYLSIHHRHLFLDVLIQVLKRSRPHHLSGPRLHVVFKLVIQCLDLYPTLYMTVALCTRVMCFGYIKCFVKIKPNEEMQTLHANYDNFIILQNTQFVVVAFLSQFIRCREWQLFHYLISVLC